MRILPLLITLLIPAFGADLAKNDIGPISTTYEQVLPLLIVGEGWSQTLVIQNVDDDRPSIGILSFYTRAGKPWPRRDQGQRPLVAPVSSRQR